MLSSLKSTLTSDIYRLKPLMQSRILAVLCDVAATCLVYTVFSQRLAGYTSTISKYKVSDGSNRMVALLSGTVEGVVTSGQRTLVPRTTLGSGHEISRDQQQNTERFVRESVRKENETHTPVECACRSKGEVWGGVPACDGVHSLRMSCSMINKFIIFLVGLIVVLQVVHITLLSRLDRDRGRTASSIQAEDGERFSPREGRRLAGSSSTSRGNVRKSSAKLSKGSLDVSGQYRIHNFYIRSDDAANGEVQLEDVTLVTQCSVQNLYHIVELSVRWDGPVSVAIFAPGENAAFADDIVGGLRRCYPLIRKYVSFHLVYPTSREAIIYEESPTLLNTPCQDILHLAKYHKSATLNYGAEKEPYPNNLLRNVARQGSSTEFIFVVDIDMLPSEKLRTDFVHFALDNRLFDSRTSMVSDHLDTVYVVPAFELQLNASIPKDKTDLLESLQPGKARPFYRDICWKCQSSTDYDKWTATKSSTKRRLDVAYNVTWKDPWEPFYIGRWSVPLYDERFKQYGFNRISQVCELHIAGYGFSVLDRAFLIHKGWKTVTDFHASKDEENNRNRLLFRQFKNELKVKYPDTDRRCY